MRRYLPAEVAAATPPGVMIVAVLRAAGRPLPCVGMTLRSKIIRLAHENPSLRDSLLPLLVDDGVKTAVSAVTIDGVRYTWKRANKAPRGRSGIGSPPDQFRPWYLRAQDDSFIVALNHNQFSSSFMTKSSDPPAWKVMLRFPSHPEEVDRHGGFVQLYLKTRFPSVAGDDEGTQEAMAAGVRAWEKMKKDRDEKLAGG